MQLKVKTIFLKTEDNLNFFNGRHLIKSKKNTDHDEFVELIPTSIEDALHMVWNGAITDVKTIIGILWAERLLS